SAWRGCSLGLGLFMLARGLWTCAQPDIVDCRAPAAGLAAALISPNVLGVLEGGADGEFLERRLSSGPAELPSAVGQTAIGVARAPCKADDRTDCSTIRWPPPLSRPLARISTALSSSIDVRPMRDAYVSGLPPRRLSRRWCATNAPSRRERSRG